MVGTRSLCIVLIALSLLDASASIYQKGLRRKGGNEKNASRKRPRHFPKKLIRRDLQSYGGNKSTEYTSSCSKGGKGKGGGLEVRCTCGKGYGPCIGDDDDNESDEGVNDDGVNDDSDNEKDNNENDDSVDNDGENDGSENDDSANDDSENDEVIQGDDGVDDLIMDENAPPVFGDDSIIADDFVLVDDQVDDDDSAGDGGNSTFNNDNKQELNEDSGSNEGRDVSPNVLPIVLTQNTNADSGSNEEQRVNRAAIPISDAIGVDIAGGEKTTIVIIQLDQDSGSNENL